MLNGLNRSLDRARDEPSVMLQSFTQVPGSEEKKSMRLVCTVYPGSSDTFYILSYYIKWVTNSWTDSNLCQSLIISFPKIGTRLTTTKFSELVIFN